MAAAKCNGNHGYEFSIRKCSAASSRFWSILGTLVRPLPQDRPDDRRVGRRICRLGEDRKDQHRRQPAIGVQIRNRSDSDLLVFKGGQPVQRFQGIPSKSKIQEGPRSGEGVIATNEFALIARTNEVRAWLMRPHDPRYLEGIEHFNKCDFFEAHEVWEELWADTQGRRAGSFKD